MKRTKYSPAKPLAVLSLTVALAFSSLAPAYSAEQTTGSADDLAQITTGQETEQVKELLPEEDVLNHPQLDAAPPVNGDGNPGATLGQGIKPLKDTNNLSEESLELGEKEVEQAKQGVDVVSDVEKVAPAEAAKVNPAASSSQKVASAGFDRVHPLRGLSNLAKAAEPTTGATLEGNRGLTVTPALAQHSATFKTVATSPTGSGVLGMDVSGWQPTVNWAAEYSQGARFAYVKATEGMTYTSPQFSRQYIGSTSVGMKRGGYHFAIPTASSGADQARYFVANGGGWSADGKTLPGLLDIEYNPYAALGNTCYNMSPSQLRSWVVDFTETYKKLTGRYPAVYTTTNWWTYCVGGMSDLNHLPLHIAAYNTVPGAMPSGYSTYDIWQYSSTGPFSGDSNVFNGTYNELQNFASNAGYKPVSTQRALAEAERRRQEEQRRLASQYQVVNGIAAYYYSHGGQSVFGYPTGNEFRSVDGGYVQNFSNSRTIYWSPTTGSHHVKWTGALGSAYARAGFEFKWGYPAIDEERYGYGWKQYYRKGNYVTAAYWSARTGTHTIHRGGAISTYWINRGHINTYGLPVTDEIRRADGSYYVKFENGKTINWSASRGIWLS